MSHPQRVDLSQLLQAFGLGRRSPNPNDSNTHYPPASGSGSALLHVPGYVVSVGAFRFFVPDALIQQILNSDFGANFDSAYEQTLDALFRQYQPQGSPSTSKEFVESLNRIVITEEKPENECVVCQENFVAGDEVLELPCQHQYHETCLTPWLAQHNTCPTCRAELPADKPIPPEQPQPQQSGAQPGDTNTQQEPGGTPFASFVPVSFTFQFYPSPSPPSSPSPSPQPSFQSQPQSQMQSQLQSSQPASFEHDGIRVRELRCELGHMLHSSCLMDPPHQGEQHLRGDVGGDAMDVDHVDPHVNEHKHEERFVTLSCGHSFHDECLSQSQRITGWGTVNNETRCPACLQHAHFVNNKLCDTSARENDFVR